MSTTNLTLNNQEAEVSVPSWKCNTGDVVSFTLKRGTGKYIMGTVLSRPAKNLASILSITGQQVMVHVGQVIVLSQAEENTLEYRKAAAIERKKEEKRRRWLEKKAAETSQTKTPKKKELKTRTVFGTTFTFS